MSNSLVFIGLSIFLFPGCGKSDGAMQVDTPQEPVEISDLKDVNAPDYWDDAELVWGDDFDGTELSMDNWTFESGSHGWGNNELQDYVANSNVEVGNGILKIIAKKEASGTARYTSARLNSTKSFRYGRLEIKAKIPDDKGRGIWPALWMLGEDINTVGWPACGEIDIMEYVSFEPDQLHFSLHSTANNHSIGTQITSGPVPLASIEEEFHVYGVLWSAKYIKFYIDNMDNITFTFFRPTNFNTENWPFSKSFYFLMNIAVGGNWGGQQGVDDTIFPAAMEIDYIHVYQVK